MNLKSQKLTDYEDEDEDEPRQKRRPGNLTEPPILTNLTTTTITPQ